MNHSDAASTATCLEQVYLIDRDAGLLCRILGLYAARAMDVMQVDYTRAAQDVMRLRVRVAREAVVTGEGAESVRVLVEKASTFVGVMRAVARADERAHLREASTA